MPKAKSENPVTPKSTSKVEVKNKKTTSEEVNQLAQKTLKLTTKNHLNVYSTKSLNTDKPARMRPGSEIILDFLQATDETGAQLVRVRKDGSTRTFYTNSNHVQEVMG
jgi:hypothetical protein